MNSPLQDILRAIAASASAGVTTKFLDEQAERLCRMHNVRPAFKGYTAPGHKTPFPAALCVSVNSEVIHGIPGDYVIQEGDVVKLDMGIEKDGEYDDGALTVLIGTVDEEGKLRGPSSAARRLVQATAEALEAGCAVAKAGKTTHDIARAIEAVAKRNDLHVVHGYGGHGIGSSIHMEPSVPNEIEPNSKPDVLKAGTRIAIEPMFATASNGITFTAADTWTVKLRSGGLAAHFERTVEIH